LDVIAEEAYVSELARFTTMSKPLMASRHASSCWLDKAVGEIPSQLAVYQRHDYKNFERLAEKLLEGQLQHPELKTALLISI
jgi:hypothetical protein